MIPPQVVGRFESAPWFHSAWSPYLLLDADLRIEAANAAFARVIGVPVVRLVGRVSSDVLAGNTDDPDGNASTLFEESVAEVLRTGKPRWLDFHRHDLPDPRRPGAFHYRVWMPVQVPVVHDGEVVGVLHHVQDVTTVFGAADGAPVTPRGLTDEMDDALERLRREFPGTPPEGLLGVLTDSLRVVSQVLGAPDVEKSSGLARLRLEVLTGVPSQPV